MKPAVVNFDQNKFILYLSIDLNQIDFEKIDSVAKEKGFYKKKEFHITIIFLLGLQIKKILDMSPQRETIAENVKNLIKETDWTFEFLPEYYQLRREYIFNDKIHPGKKIKELRESIIQLVSLPSLNNFYTQLNKILSSDFSVPFPHVTLFVKGDKGEKSDGIGIPSTAEFHKLQPVKLTLDKNHTSSFFHTIILPTRPQPDTLIAIFLLKKFGTALFPGIAKTKIELWQIIPAGKSADSLEKEGFFLLDIGGGMFDHHNKSKTTVSDLLADYLGVKDNPALNKLLEYARRDDFYGKGTISTDSLDRAFGLSGLITAMNKTFKDNPSKTLDTILVLLEAHYEEERKRTTDMPLEVEQKLKEGKAQVIKVRQRKNNLKVIYIESDNTSLAGFLRSQQGGRHDIVAQRLSSGHMNILTRPTKHVDLRPLVVLIRNAELMLKGNSYDSNFRKFSQPGRLENLPQWYFDDATNSILNGGTNPTGINATGISTESFLQIIKLAFN